MVHPLIGGRVFGFRPKRAIRDLFLNWAPFLSDDMAASRGGRLVRLELENFKSYHGRQIIGPFEDNFVSIIGPNGAGKSNLMDALSFVLGIQSAQLRSTSLADLIYRDGSRVAGHASVTAVYARSDGVQVSLSRRVTSHGHSEYRIDGKTASYTDYCRAWEQENVLIKARNFLVFQGDVEAVASKSPRELTNLFEQISGSEEYRAEYDRCKTLLDRALEESTLNFNRRKGLGAELKQVQEQREDVLRYERLVAERTALQVEFHLWQLFHAEEDARRMGAQLEAKEAELSEAEAAVQKLEAAWRDAKKKAAKGQKDILAAERDLRAAQRQLTDEAPTSVQLEEQLKFSSLRAKALEDGRNGAHGEAARCARDIQAIEGELAEIAVAAEEFEATSARQLEASANIAPALMDEYHRLRETASQKLAKERGKLESLERKLSPDYIAKQTLQDKLKELQTAQKRVDAEASRLTERETQVKNQQSIG